MSSTYANYQPLANGEAKPFPGVPIRTLNTIKPKPGEVIVRYVVVSPTTGCCQCDDLSVLGWVSVGLAAVFFWPAMCIPCCIPACFDKYQVPIYGPPSELPKASPPVAVV
mmetsp:Transcript_48732/g.123059  ORF Transcript_48732/g.123059 Transcript_48732/m.123059 type:complete len:110 (-) Transcript_48732:226-555(-)|eukprot:jgi/Tetstr1/456031/TSEL_042807.t1